MHKKTGGEVGMEHTRPSGGKAAVEKKTKRDDAGQPGKTEANMAPKFESKMAQGEEKPAAQVQCPNPRVLIGAVISCPIIHASSLAPLSLCHPWPILHASSLASSSLHCPWHHHPWPHHLSLILGTIILTSLAASSVRHAWPHHPCILLLLPSCVSYPWQKKMPTVVGKPVVGKLEAQVPSCLHHLRSSVASLHHPCPRDPCVILDPIILASSSCCHHV